MGLPKEIDDFYLPSGSFGPLSQEYVEEAAQRAGDWLRRYNQGGKTRNEAEEMREFGLQVRGARLERGLSYPDLAEKLGCEENFLIFLESGLATLNEVDNLRKGLADLGG